MAGIGNDEAKASENKPSEAVVHPELEEESYGWVVVAAVFLLNAHTWGLNSAYAVFLAYYLNSNFFPDASRIAFAFVGGLSISIALLVAPLATICVARLGTRTTLWIGIVFETVAFIGASFVTEIWQLVLSQGIAFGIGMGFIFTGSVGLLPQWFSKRRSFANALGAGGSGFGGLIYSLGANAMIQNLGLPWAFRILAILAFTVNTAASFLAKDRNKQTGAIHSALKVDLLKRTEFNLYIGWALFSILGYVVLIFSLADYAQSVGFSASQGSIAAAMFNLSQGVGRPIIGLASDRVGRLNIAGICSLLASAAAYILWTFAGKSYAGLIVYALFGAFAGVIWPTIAPVAVEIFGISLLPSVMSVSWIVLVIPATFSEVIALQLTKPGPDGYLHCQMFTGSMFFAAFVFMWCLRIWKLHQVTPSRLVEEQASERPPTRFSVRSVIRAAFAVVKV